MSASAILVVGAGPLQVPAFDVARRMGLRAIAVDRNPDAPGMALAAAAHAVDTRDTEGVIEVARREGIAGVLTLCTDAPVVVVAAVAHALGLPGLSRQAALLATNKALMRDALAAAGVPIPAYRKVRSLDEARIAATQLGLPVILKPPASSGSRGIFKVVRPDQLEAGWTHARAVAGESVALLVEEFVEGDEVSVETLSVGSDHHVIAITDKRTTGDPFWVETGHVEPSRLPEPAQRAIEACARSSLDALGVTCAAGHVEIKMGHDGPRLIELGARLGGDFITTELVRRSTGVDMVEAVIRLSLGESPSCGPRWRRGASIRYLVPPEGRLEAVDGIGEATSMPGVVRLELMLRPGDEFQGVRSSLDRPGFVIAEGADASEAEDRAAAAAAAIRFRMAPTRGAT